MRSLSLLAASFSPVAASSSAHPRDTAPALAATAVDPATNARYAVTVAHPSGPDGDAHLDVWQLSPPHSSPQESPRLLVSFPSPPVPPTLDPSHPFVVSFAYLPEDDALALVLASGEVEQVFLQGGGGEARRENVGTFDAGIRAAEWSPDQELLAIVTGTHQLLLLTRTFDPLSESPLHTSSAGQDAPVSVGWGHKSTQFHGSLGKSAAAAAAAADPLAVPWLRSRADDGQVRVRWRGDGAWFAVSSVERVPRSPAAGEKEEEGREVRRVRIYSRLGEHSSTSEPTPGLESALAWMPSGELLAATQRRVVDKDTGREEVRVVFFERNGLRRSDFALREEEVEGDGGAYERVTVRELEWNAGSDVLAVWLERDGRGGAETEHAVQLWHRNNYYWYLKSSLTPRLSPSPSLTARGLAWHPEQALSLSLLTPAGLEAYELCWETHKSEVGAPWDDGTVAVNDGGGTKLTPFRLQNVPPPMSSLVLRTSPSSAPPAHIAFCSAQANARAGLSAPALEWSVEMPAAEGGGGVERQCAVVGGKVAMLRSLREGGEEVLLVQEGGKSVRSVRMREGARRLVAKAPRERRAGQEDDEEAGDKFLLETAQGEIFEVTASSSDDFALPSNSLSPLPEFCPHVSHLYLPPASPASTLRLPAMVGLSSSGRLYASSRLLATDASSYALTPDFLIYTTFSHEAKFLPLTSLAASSSNFDAYHSESFARRAGADEAGGGSIKRAVERGSRIVAVVPSKTTLVLQMPRGNLETICPRPLVLQVVRSHLDSHRYRAAFLLCRRHRIDLNLLHDHDPGAFVASLHDFVSQIKDVDHLNLFLSGLKDEDVTETMYRPLVVAPREQSFDTTNKVNRICDLVRADLEQRDVFHYANSILTAHVRKRPPAYEDALKVLVDLKAKDAERAEDAVKYIIFLSDANKLFDLALGMYDFALVLMVAQQSQKDPREYLPFLRALRALPPALQRHQIDDHLSRHASALRNLAQAGDEHFEAAVEYTKKWRLWEVALEVYEGKEGKYEVILCANAEDLFDRSKYFEAALLFTLAGEPEKAMLSYQRAHAWQELFTLALSSGKVDAEGIKEMAADVAENLSGKRRYADAARVLLEYGEDVDGAIHTLCEGALHSEAIRIATLQSQPQLIDERVKPSTLELQQRLLDDCSDLEEQVEKQVSRLSELKRKRDENPYYYFCIDDPVAALENVEIAPEGMSDAGTAFTRYTVNPTTLASSTRRTSRTAGSRKRAALKKAAGKKGTVYEEMYLLNSMKKSAETRLAELQTETGALLPVLLTLSPTSSEHRAAAFELQRTLSALVSTLSEAVSTVWDPLEAAWRAEALEEQRVRDSGDPMRVAEWEQRPRPVEGEEETKRVERPKVADEKWRIGLLDAGRS
ncbi:hypothetical protein Rhopal_005542-T1 [Rhodotorula paludigena]|uniref:Elongator complex protein 1 n=1 Tax=Rhodotorula paludigena TaxID=86838 RepID=A0AAV5GTZ4_9BASI|nr:hypothetical protein Rhopal_005542-T1 [Rhodotorula paludigena]